MSLRPLALGSLLLAVAGPPAAAQLEASAEAQTSTRYVWRGTTRHRGAVLHPIVAVSWRGFTLSGRLAILDDPCGQRPGGCLSGGDGIRVGDRDLALSKAVTLTRALDLSLGVAQRSIGSVPWSGVPRRGSTTEAVLSLGTSPSRGLQWAATGWYDLGPVKGLYAELTATVPVAIPQGGIPNVFVSSGLGVSAGQAADDDEGYYYDDNGVTHAWLEVTMAFARATNGRRVGWQAFTRVQGNFDAATRRAGLLSGRTREQRIWFGVAVRGVRRAAGPA